MISEHGTAGLWRTLNERSYVHIDAPTRCNGTLRSRHRPVPASRVWVMDHHRNDSADSRRYLCRSDATVAKNLDNCNPVSSTVPISDIIGFATSIVSPLSRCGPH
jgi:hypothetical protein